MYNKVDNQGALMGNWVEEEALRRDTGNSRYQTWNPKEGMGLTHPRVIQHTEAVDTSEYKASSKVATFGELVPSSLNNMGPRERRRLEELQAQAKAIKQSQEKSTDVNYVKESSNQAAYKAYDPSYLVHGIVRVPPRGKGGFKDFDPSIVGKTRGEVAASDAAQLKRHEALLPHQETISRYSHAVTSGQDVGVPFSAASQGRNPFGKSTALSNDIMDAKICHGEASDPGAENVAGIGINIQTRAALVKIQEWTQAPDKRRALQRLCTSSGDDIPLADFSRVLHEVGLPLSDKDILQIFVFLDKGKEGRIQWKSFQTLLAFE
ncbi:hypothetical protein AeMF1_009689 [Aphanomyces euteiches]|nr:hypothetical protein AeMF1_009689 [Aphanomyces euteiches]KAH9196957.1 hypothetical protein AeNC1_001078 [Aphanomyces euteiches]